MSFIATHLSGFGAGARLAGIDEFTKLMLHCDGTDASTSFPDSSAGAKTVTANGNAQVDTAQSKFGGASGLFDGTGDYLSVPDSADWDFGSGDFTIDLWVRSTTTSGDHVIIERASPSIDPGAAAFLIDMTGGNFRFLASADGATYGVAILSMGAVAADTWAHLAVTRSGSDIRTFKDGALIASTTSASALFDVAFPVMIGAGSNGSVIAGWNGWIDEVRISKGVARWTAAFTPPDEPYS
jgi:hypothetical protein